MDWNSKQKAVKIAGMRRVLPNRTPKKTNPFIKIKEALNSLKYNTGEASIETCIIEHSETVTIYEKPDLKIIFGNKNNVMGYIVGGPSIVIEKTKNDEDTEIPEDFEEAVQNIMKLKNEGCKGEECKEEECKE